MDTNKYPFLLILLSCLCLPLSSAVATAQGEISYEDAFPNLAFEFPVEVQEPGDGSDRLFVVEQTGRIKVFANDRGAESAETVLDVTDIVSFSPGQEIGLLGLAFHPNFSENRYFYVYHTRQSDVSGVSVELVCARYTMSASNPNRAEPASRLDIFSFDKNQNNSNHNGGKIAFGPDGYLYASLGDGGGGGDPNRNAQDIGNVFGSILRIDIDVDGSNPVENNPDLPNGNYEIPADNPLVGRSGLDELYLWGLRNTWKFSFDDEGDRMWGGDVGQGEREEVNLLQAGGNYGWNRFEGNRTYRSATTLATTPDIKPVYEYDHDNGDVSITLGYVYRGALSNPAVQGKLIFGDFASGRVWALDYDGADGGASAELLFRTDGEAVSSFFLDRAGELYFSGYGQRASLFRIVDEDDRPPTTTAVDGVGSWQGLGAGISGVVEATVTDGSTVYAAGSFSEAGSVDANNVAAYTEGGGWSALGSGSNGKISALAVDADGRLYAGGDFTRIGGVAAANVAVWDGEAWSALGAGTEGPVLALGVNADNDLLAGGAFASAGGVTVNNIARWSGGWSALTDAETGEPGTNNEVRSIATDEDGVLYVGGNFASAGDRPANRIATFDGSRWGSLGDGTSGFVQAIVITETSVYIGGNFAVAGGQTVNRVARWDRAARTWQPLGSGLSGSVNALAYDGTYLYVGGNFETATLANNQGYIVRNVARWSDPGQWEALGTAKQVGTTSPVTSLQVAAGGDELYAGGSFDAAGASDAAGIALWSNSSTDVGIVDGAVYELEPQHDTRLRLDVRRVSTANSAPVDGFRRNGNANQQWKFISLGNDVYEIEPQHAPGKLLDVAGASTATNTEIHIYQRKSTTVSNQRWKALPVGNGTYRFEPQNAPGNRLDIENVDGVPRALSRTLDSGNSQRWRLVPVSGAVAQRNEVQEASDMTFNLYPNPVTDRLTVESEVGYRFTLYDATGRRVIDEQHAEGTVQIGVGHLAAGLYVAQLSAEGRRPISTRIFVE